MKKAFFLLGVLSAFFILPLPGPVAQPSVIQAQGVVWSEWFGYQGRYRDLEMRYKCLGYDQKRGGYFWKSQLHNKGQSPLTFNYEMTAVALAQGLSSEFKL